MNANTQAIYRRLLRAPDDWIESRAGRNMIAKSLRHVRRRDGRDESHALREMLYLAWGAALLNGKQDMSTEHNIDFGKTYCDCHNNIGSIAVEDDLERGLQIVRIQCPLCLLLTYVDRTTGKEVLPIDVPID